MKAQTIPPVRLAQLAADDDRKQMAAHEGWAALYGIEIDRMFAIMELARGLFGDSIKDPSKILILNQHDTWQPIGLADKFDDREDGLWMDFLLNTEVQAGAECDSNIRHGVLSGLSVGFDVNRVEIEKRGEGPRAYEVEVITDATLKEVSAVSFPAIDGARVQNGKPIDPAAAVTFSVLGHDGVAQERLHAGDHVRLATFPARGPGRTRPRPQLAEDQKYPGAHAELMRILAMKL